MHWEKSGLIFCPQQHHPWMWSHAANTVAEYLQDDVFRIYFSCRNEENRAHIGYVEVEIADSFRVLEIAKYPVLIPGEVGLFDDSGVSLSCITRVKGKMLLYYLGWNLGVTVPWRNSIGLAIFNSVTDRFEKFTKAPLIDRNEIDPYSISYPFVMEDEAKFKMWYGSNLSWGTTQEEMSHVIKYAESDDGIHWSRTGIISLNFKNETEYALSRPFVIKENGKYKMWYSYRGSKYRIGYAESDDSVHWERMDDLVGIDVSPDGWDSEMICYPFIFDHKGNRYMLYNGNGYGKTGFGIARLTK